MTPPEVTDDMVIACMTKSPRVRRLVREITEEVALCLVRKTGIAERTANLPERVIAAVCKYYGTTEKQLRGQSRVMVIAGPRMVAMAVMRQRGMSFPEIGRALGGRDHSTVMSGCQSVEDRFPLRSAIPAVIALLDAEPTS
jgi:chromosomal replication initiation ATPase DnaA